MKTILLTGANGLLGHEVLRKLSHTDGYFIHALTQGGLGDKDDIELNRVKVIQSSLSGHNMHAHLPEKADVIIHLAQSNNFRNFPGMAHDIFDVNVQSTMNLLDYARSSGCKQFIYTSTGGVYTGGTPPFFEDASLAFDAATGFYATSKYMSELLVQNYSGLFNTVIFRPFFIYGKRQKKDMLIPRLVENVKQGNEIKIEGDSGLKINPIYVGDAADAMIASLELQGAQRFNLGGSEVLSLKEICEIIAAKMNKKANFTFVDNAAPKDMYGDISKLTEILGNPATRFEKGVEELLTYEK